MQYLWDAKTYSQLKLPHLHWGDELLSRCGSRGNESILEIGCGTGRDTEKLARRVPEGHVLAIDSSGPMLELATMSLGSKYPNIEFRNADIQDELVDGGDFDIAFSVAAFHWIPNHRKAFANVAGALEPKGVFLADCGGKGNVDSIRGVVRSILGSSEADRVWNFADVGDTENNLRDAGFETRDVRLVPDPARFESKEIFGSFLSTLVLGAHMTAMEAEERLEFVNEVIARLPEMTIDYVRLKIEAVKL